MIPLIYSFNYKQLIFPSYCTHINTVFTLSFFKFLYLDRVENEAVKVERKKPAFTGWTNYSVLQRNQVDVVDNTYGKGKIVSIVNSG